MDVGQGLSGNPAITGAVGTITLIVWTIMMLSMAAGYLIMLIALWRISTAHKSIAKSLEGISEKLDSKSDKQ